MDFLAFIIAKATIVDIGISFSHLLS